MAIASQYGHVSFWRSAGLWLVPMMAMLLSMISCRSAGEIKDGYLTVQNRFKLELLPDPPWRLQTNQAVAGRAKVIFRARGGLARLYVRTEPLTPALKELPVELLGEVLFMREMQLRGQEARLQSLTRVAIDEREAVAATGHRWERPRKWQSALVAIKGENTLVLLCYEAPEGEFERRSGALELLLRRFKLLFPEPFDPYLLEELPMGAPGPSPGNRTGRPPADAPQPIRPGQPAPF